MITVYCITHILTERRYIGMTRQGLRRRWGKHLSAARSGVAHPFLAAVRAGGAEQFSLDVLEECATDSEGQAAEVWWTSLFRSNEPAYGFNISPGGRGLGHHFRGGRRASATA